MTKEITAVRDAWEQHVDGTEKPGGLYEEIVTTSPRFAGTIDRLRDEHPEITEAVEQMLARLEQVEIGGLPWPLEDARDDLQRFIGRDDPAPSEGRRPRVGGLQRGHRRPRVGSLCPTRTSRHPHLGDLALR